MDKVSNVAARWRRFCGDLTDTMHACRAGSHLNLSSSCWPRASRIRSRVERRRSSLERKMRGKRQARLPKGDRRVPVRSRVDHPLPAGRQHCLHRTLLLCLPPPLLLLVSRAGVSLLRGPGRAVSAHRDTSRFRWSACTWVLRLRLRFWWRRGRSRMAAVPRRVSESGKQRSLQAELGTSGPTH